MTATLTSTPDVQPFGALAAAVRAQPRRTVAVVWPHDAASLSAVLEARTIYGIEPILVGDAAFIGALLVASSETYAPRIVDAGDDREAAALAVALVRAGEADILMKGHLHSDDFLRPALDRAGGLRGDRIMSHVFACALPPSVYPKTLYVTDAAFNIAPDLATKRAIAQNAIDLARALGVECPKVAILAAVESVNPAMPCTLDAAALCKMADRGQITGGILDGPLAFDNAISRRAADGKGIRSAVAGDPDILLVPAIETGNVMYKQMVHFCGAVAPGIVLGGRAPILLASRSEPIAARIAAIGIAAMLAGPAAGAVQGVTS